MAGGTTPYRDDDAGAGAITDINVTPLVDITLVLLIIFMVTARLIVARGIDVESPKTVSGAEIKGTIEVTIQPGPKWFVNGEPAPDKAAIERAIRAALAGDADLRPIITADRRVPHGDVMEIVDLIKLAGVKRFAMTTEVKRDE
ncbi:MAG: biopolymer transporter ExbD [Deltaproteobacteria bacterium]|nr:MAG: biopolymer transporter ExbD [Deltaproteobacteria bacterium]